MQFAMKKPEEFMEMHADHTPAEGGADAIHQECLASPRRPPEVDAAMATRDLGRTGEGGPGDPVQMPECFDLCRIERMAAGGGYCRRRREISGRDIRPQGLNGSGTALIRREPAE
jgi:hypothetical protein